MNQTMPLTEEEIDRVIEMAWEDRTPFEAIFTQFGLTESTVIELMRRKISARNWRKWRARVHGRATKHAALRAPNMSRFRCDRQRQISQNRISKR